MVEGAELGYARTDPRDFGCDTRNQRHRIVPIGAFVQGIFLATNLLGLQETSEESPVQVQIQHLIFVVTAIGFAGGFIAYLFEQHASPTECGDTCIDTLPQAMWWAITTATTVGYGDYAPVTPGGRVVAIFLMFTGIALYGLLTVTLSQLIWAKGRKYGKNERGDVDSNEMIERLERLADMRRDGWLTATEFHDAKKSVLTGKMPGGTRREISSHVPPFRVMSEKPEERLRVQDFSMKKSSLDSPQVDDTAWSR